MVKLRLARAGGKRRAVYQIVAADSRSPRDGRFIENLGQYDPNAIPALIRVKQDRINHWLSTGAQPSETVHKLLLEHGRRSAESA